MAMKYDAKCLRKSANWTKMKTVHKFDKEDTFSSEQVLKDMAKYSPKMVALIDNIKKLDEKDMQETGKKYKHFIFSDVKQGGFGAKIIASALIASGFDHGYRGIINSIKIQSDEDLLLTRGNNFLLLCSSALFLYPLTVQTKKDTLAKFNKRPENINGDLVRFIILDSGFKEGIDLFDVKYIHVFEPQVSKADQQQVIGRGTRTCGQKGLEFHPSKGWPLHVFIYDVSIPKELSSEMGADTMFKMYMQNSGIDLRKLLLANEFEKYAIVGSVDYELNKNIHNFEIEDDEIYYDIFTQYGGERKKPTEVHCEKNCGKRPTKDVPISNAMFISVYFALKRKFPATFKDVKTREFFCNLLKTDKMFCKKTKEIFDDRVTFVKLNAKEIIKAIKLKYHNELSLSIRSSFLRFIFGILPPFDSKEKEKNKLTKIEPVPVPLPVPVPVPMPQNEKKKIIKKKQPDLTDKVEEKINIKPSLPTKKVSFLDMRRHVRENFSQFAWPKVQLENMCGPPPEAFSEVILPPEPVLQQESFVQDNVNSTPTPTNSTPTPTNSTPTPSNDQEQKGGAEIIKFSPSQDFIRHFFKPQNDAKGMLLWHSVGTGKTCSAIAAATSSFEKEGYTILWVTRTTLKSDIWKNMFDQVCNMTIQEDIEKGLLIPDKMKDKMKLLSSSWSIRPMSYKQFSNLVVGNNNFYKQLVKKNGNEDPLKKTLLIIDEAHKLYGGTDLSSVERPNMKKLHAAIMKSYEVSGKDSVRLMLMTATPFTNDPIELIQLLNLCRESNQQLPTDYETFSRKYLTPYGTFSKKGSRRFLDDIAGLISYLNRERDARQFAQPRINYVTVPISTSGDNSLDLIKANIKESIDQVKEKIKTMKEQVNQNKKQLTQDKRNVKASCKGLKKQEKEKCLEEAEERIEELERNFIENKSNIEKEIVDVKGEIKKIRSDSKNKIKEAKDDPSQLNIIRNKCSKIKKKNQDDAFDSDDDDES
jgi:superfamily II DNA or RNA helicase